MRRQRILIYSQSLVGLGHVVRGVALAEALSDDFEVSLVSGWTPELSLSMGERYRTVGLCRMRLDLTRPVVHPLDFLEDDSCLMTSEAGMTVSEAMTARRKRIMREVVEFEPDVVITEYYPLGRWIFGLELLPAIEEARRRGAKIVCSVRDNLRPLYDESGERKLPGAEYGARCGGYYRRAIDLLNSRYDALLVHSDEQLISLRETVPGMEEIVIPIIYTGYLSSSLNVNVGAGASMNWQRDGVPYIVMSAGGGHGERDFFRAWLPAIDKVRAARLGSGGKVVALAGPLMEAESYSRLMEMCSVFPNIELKRYCGDFQRLLDGATLSVSRAGYNTAVNILRSKTPALIMPAGLLGDQEVRARRFDALRIAEYCDPNLEEDERAARVESALGAARGRRRFNTNGAMHTRDAVERIAGGGCFAGQPRISG